MNYKRDYRFRSGNTSKESRQFWIMIVIAIILGAAIMYFF